ncbi:MAG: hypothetical protein ACRC37_06760, partial [Lentisphaeria bacterium]
GILAAALGMALGGAKDKAMVQKTNVLLNDIRLGMAQYQNAYGRPPKDIENLLSSGNARKHSFLPDDKLPIDPFATGVNREFKIITKVSKITKDKKGNVESIESGKGNGYVIYSVGPNGIDEKGINNGRKDGIDDISIYVAF